MFGLTFAAITLNACVPDRGAALAEENEPISQIRSVEDLDMYRRTTSESPFDYLPAKVQQHFIDSLVFAPTGLASFQYSDLEGLPRGQIHQILSLFNVENTIPVFMEARISRVSEGTAFRPAPRTDYPGYRCVPPATCVASVGSICIADNCRTP